MNTTIIRTLVTQQGYRIVNAQAASDLYKHKYNVAVYLKKESEQISFNEVITDEDEFDDVAEDIAQIIAESTPVTTTT